MNSRIVLNRVVTIATIAGMIAGMIVPSVWAATVLQEGNSVSGYIRNTSPSLRYRNQSKTGAPTQTARGEEYTFTAQRGDAIEISVDAEDGSNLRPVLVLLAPRTGKQVAYDATLGLLRYNVPTAGIYKLLVIGQNNTRGRYTLEIAGLSGPSTGQVSQADQVMRDVLRLNIIGCGVPNVAKIKIGAEERCTRDIDLGQYVYNETSRSISLIDSRRDLIAQRLQLAVLDRCPTSLTSIARITTLDPQDGREYVYCATPNRFVSAGNYRYDIGRDELKPADAAQTPPIAQPTSTPTNDPRRTLLQDAYGLRVLDNCPPDRTNLVVASFPESSQTYIYCATPNRVVTAGEYIYNTSTDKLAPASKPAPACTVSVGGVCLVQ